jgi:1,4-alpha-glucan branching enzyme
LIQRLFNSSQKGKSMSNEIGAHFAGDGRCEFVVWAQQVNEVAVKIVY